MLCIALAFPTDRVCTYFFAESSKFDVGSGRKKYWGGGDFVCIVNHILCVCFSAAFEYALTSTQVIVYCVYYVGEILRC